MRKLLITIGAGLAAVILFENLPAADSPPTANKSSPRVSNQAELNELRDTLRRYRPDMVRVTDKPFHVAAPKKILPEDVPLCAPIGFKREPKASNPHSGHWIHVFITPDGRGPLTKGTGTYPVGTIILKQKLLDAAGKKIDFYTGMLKREPGYNRDMADWEFFTTDASGEKVTTRGKLKDCMSCHRDYPDTDFVSRQYLERP